MQTEEEERSWLCYYKQGRIYENFVSPDLLLHPPVVHSTADFSANDVMVSHEIAKQCRQEKIYMLASNKTATLRAKAGCTRSAAKQASE